GHRERQTCDQPDTSHHRRSLHRESTSPVRFSDSLACPMPLEPGTRLGPYEILAPLGAGGMGEVYRARDTRLEREVAIKVLPERFTRDPDRRNRFEREAKAVAALSHPNILAIHDYAAGEDISFAVMELLQGETLR